MKTSRPTALKTMLTPLTKKGWKTNAKQISKSYKFKDFAQAFSFMMRAAIKIDRLDHHPEWSNTYNKVDVTLTTHDKGGVTDKDVALAAIMDEIAKKLIR